MAHSSPTAAMAVPVPPALRHPSDPSSSTHPPLPAGEAQMQEGEQLAQDIFRKESGADTGTSGVSTPRSAVISVPSGWADSPTGGSSRVSRNSMDADVDEGAEGDDPGLTPGGGYPLSASSSSQSSNPVFQWPKSFGLPSPQHTRAHPSDRKDPFDETASFSDDPFARGNSSSSEDEAPGLKRSMAGSMDTTSSFDHFDLSGVATLPPAPPSIDPLGEERRGSVTLIPLQPRAATESVLVDGQPPVDPEFAAVYGANEGDEFNFDATPTTNGPPAFNRTFSAPLPSRVGYLRHPLSPITDPLHSYSAHPPVPHTARSPALTPLTARPNVRAFDSGSSTTTKADSSPTSDTIQTPLQTFSMELADSLQAAIQTLLHLSPPHLLDNAKEQYSGCTVQMPSTSLSALLTSMKSLNYLSANVETLASGLADSPMDLKREEGILTNGFRRSDDFDVGELLQNVADLLSGQASQKGVDLVLFHGDVGIKHVSVAGDPEGLAYCLSHIMRQILVVANRGDTIELGLQIIPQSPAQTPRVSLPLTAEDVDRHRGAKRDSPTRPSSPGRTLLAPTGQSDGPVLCIFEIVHNISQTVDSAAATPRAEKNPFTTLSEQQTATIPKLDTILCRRLLLHQNASLKVDAQPSSPLGSGLPRRAYELSILLPRGKPLADMLTEEEEAIRQPFTSMKLAKEPTLEELSTFAESLRGKKVALHANLTSVFARHLTSYLGAWGMDISHIPIDDDAAASEAPIRPAPPTRQATISTDMNMGSEIESLSKEPPTPSKSTEKFIIIDDDVVVLRRELIRLRIENNPLAIKPRLTKRPTLNARTRSTPHIRQQSVVRPNPGMVLIHFTSLAKYNQVRDVVSSFLGAPSVAMGGTFIHPEVIVIPKPVGPRRFLTALHTAVNQPVVDPFFSPIATSPRSPGGASFGSGIVRTPSGGEVPIGGFFDSVIEESSDGEHPRTISDGGSQKAKSPLGEFPPAQASVIRTREGLHLSLPTPGDIMATPAAEYFSNSTMRSSGSSSAVVMSSPDGRPFGMFFEPPVKSERRASNPRIPTNIRRMSSRKTSNASTTAIEEGHATSASTSPSASKRPSTIGEDGEPTAPSSRRSSGRGEGLLDAASVRSAAGSRRKTLPTNGMEPIIAKGRERSSTITKGSLKRVGPGASPVLPSPKEEDIPAFPSRPSSKKVVTVAGMAADEEGKRDKVEITKGEEKVKPAPKKAKEDVVVPPINVLVVEDNPINQNILSMFLRKKKIKHQTAKDGLEAVEKWRTGGFHLILMDIQLPVMDGIEATKEIRKMERSNNIGVFPSTPVAEHHRTLSNAALTSIEETATVPSSPFRSSVIIVALTASSLQSDRVVALAAGCNDFLTKPVSLKWLERKIVEWGCMQALIDFDGWRRWKSTDSKDGLGDTKRGFQLGPQAAAKSLAGRLRIERKPTRGNSASATSDSSTPSASGAPDLIVRTATPDQIPEPPKDPVGSPAKPRSPSQTIAAESLQAARQDLQENKMLSAIALDPPPPEIRATPAPLVAVEEQEHAVGRRGSAPIDDFTPVGSRENTQEHVKVPPELREGT